MSNLWKIIFIFFILTQSNSALVVLKPPSTTSSTVNDVWVNETGDTMYGNLNMNGNSIVDIGSLVLGSWKVYDDSNYFKVYNLFNGGALSVSPKGELSVNKLVVSSKLTNATSNFYLITKTLNLDLQGQSIDEVFQTDLSRLTISSTDTSNYTTYVTCWHPEVHHYGSGYVNKLVALLAEGSLRGAGTIGNLVGLEISLAKGSTATGSVTNAYGLLVHDITFAANNYALKTGKGKVELGDNLNVNGRYLVDGNYMFNTINFSSNETSKFISLDNAQNYVIVATPECDAYVYITNKTQNGFTLNLKRFSSSGNNYSQTSSYDGYIFADFTTTPATYTIYDTENYIYAGLGSGATERGFFEFNTSIIPDDAEILDIVFKFTLYQASTTDFCYFVNITNAPSSYSDAQTLYDDIGSGNSYASFDCSTTGYKEINMSSAIDDFKSRLQEDKFWFGFRTDEATFGDFPTIYSSESSNPPILEVTYSTGDTVCTVNFVIGR